MVARVCVVLLAALAVLALVFVATRETPRATGLGPLPDVAQGAASAPATIVEYASLTCTHCAAFHDAVWPEIKRRYVDAGRARFILREFPLDPLATAAFMLARCAGGEKRAKLIDALFARQREWAFVEKPVAPLLAVARTVGMSEADANACLGDRALYDAVKLSRERAEEALGVRATPTFFVNGRKLEQPSLAEFERALAAP